MTNKQLIWFAIIMGVYALVMIGWSAFMIVKYT